MKSKNFSINILHLNEKFFSARNKKRLHAEEKLNNKLKIFEFRIDSHL